MAHANPSKPFIIETDASDFALGAILSQYQEDNLLHPVAFYSRKFTSHEINYDIYDKELLAIITAFEQWRQYLHGAQHQILVFCDHKNLQYFTTTRILNRRQARWSLFLSDFDFKISYRPGSEQGKSDALSRRQEYQPQEGDLAILQQETTLLKPEIFHLNAISLIPTDSTLMNHIQELIKTDPFALDVLEHLNHNPHDNPGNRSDYNKFTYSEDLLYRDGLLYVPDTASRLDILRSHHDSKLAGHFGIAKTLELVTRNYWWPRLRTFVKEYIRTCDTCARSKTPRHLPYGKLLPLPIPTRQWQSISMDFITDLPLSEDSDSILVVVDHLSKMAHFLPCSKDITADQTASLFLKHVIRLHGLPDDIVSDRGPQFASRFWSCLFKLLGTKTNLSSAYHPQSDGQTERVNQILEQYLRCFINYQQDNWVDLLPLAEFTYNNTTHASTKTTPFYANYGYHPRFDIKPSVAIQVPAAEDQITHLQDVTQSLISEIKLAQKASKEFADEHRCTPPPFKIGDQVWLLRRNVKTNRPSGKLDFKRLGPFTIIKEVNPVAFRLNLPPSLKIHDVFHVSLLEPYFPNSIPGRTQEPPPPVTIEGETEYEVNEILDSKILRRRLLYLVDWKGYAPSERSWEPAKHLHCPELVQDFHTRYPLKPSLGKPP